MRVLITGAAGNLGNHLSRHLLNDPVLEVRLMIHNTPLQFDAGIYKNAEVCRADLGNTETLTAACEGVDCIVHFAGVLFKPRPESFLPVTNVVYFRNLVDTAIKTNAGKIILISFPHVEGNTSPENPARGKLDEKPISVHAQTRLKEEQYLFEKCKGTSTVPVSLRAGMIYGKNILMLDAGKYLMRKHLLAVWKKPTWIHLISIEDFCSSVNQAIIGNKVQGIYHLGDERPLFLQEFLDMMADHLHYHRPWRLPVWCIYIAAWFVEVFATVFGTKSPLTRDFIKIGMVTYTGDTSRMKAELLPVLKYPTIEEGIGIL